MGSSLQSFPPQQDPQFVAGSQSTNALAFVIDGIYYGVPNFEYAVYSMRMDVMDHEFAIHAGS